MKPQICKEPKKLAELGVRNFCGDFNARNKLELKRFLPDVMVFFAYKWSRDDSFLIARWPKKNLRRENFSRFFLKLGRLVMGFFSHKMPSYCRWCSHHIETEVLWPFYNKGVKKEVYNYSLCFKLRLLWQAWLLDCSVLIAFIYSKEKRKWHSPLHITTLPLLKYLIYVRSSLKYNRNPKS